MSDRIEIGDSVHIAVNAEDTVSVDGTVLYIPNATGDCFHIKSTNGQLVYVQTFAAMWKKK
jgi:hypothetical protein